VFSLRTFTERFGEPISFLFKGQVWDSRLSDSTPSERRCAVCRRHVRFVFILKQLQTSDPTANPEIGKLEIGRCCFHYLRKWNAKLFEELLHALQYEKNREAAIRMDKKRFAEWTAIKLRVREWGSLRHQGRIRLKQLQQMNAVAPVSTVAGLVTLINRSPQKRTLQWFDQQIKELRQKIGELSI
jgi:hypothetical protein